MQNISAVYGLMGRSWLCGLKPAKNVGTNVTRTIERIILDEEGGEALPAAVFNSQVSELLKEPIQSPPPGKKNPANSSNTASGFERHPAVVAYVYSALVATASVVIDWLRLSNRVASPILKLITLGGWLNRVATPYKMPSPYVPTAIGNCTSARIRRYCERLSRSTS